MVMEMVMKFRAGNMDSIGALLSVFCEVGG